MNLLVKTIPCLILTILVLKQDIRAQVTDTIKSQGTIAGKVKDSTLNYYLQTATVSVYDFSDKLIGYTLTNTLGEFKIKNIPLNIDLSLKISFIGYKTFSKSFQIDPEKNDLNLGELYVEKNFQMLEDVTITPPPVRLNKDTLEFFAEAFDLDKNATTEDLLKKLPGVVIWADGMITVNGKEITKLLVNGKPFFGGESKIATQNLPKAAIERVQVYQEYINPDNPYDSTTAINLKLKKNAEKGLFGILAAGAGTRDAFETTLGLNLYDSKNQIGFIGQANNVNKIATDLNSLLRNSTFKSSGVESDNQTDFDIEGANKQFAGGVLYTHDFIPRYNNEEQNRLTGNIFYKQNQNQTNRETNVFNFLEQERTSRRHTNYESLSKKSDLNVSGSYHKLKNYQSRFMEVDFNDIRQNLQKRISSEVEGVGKTSYGEQYDSSFDNTSQISLKMGIDHNGISKSDKSKLNIWKIDYSLSAEQMSNNKLSISSLENSLGIEQNKIDRRYQNSSQATSHRLSASLGDFGNVLFRNFFRSPRLIIKLENNLALRTKQLDNRISDRNIDLLAYDKNPVLSTIGNYLDWGDEFGIRIGKNHFNILANRYQKDWRLEVIPKFIFTNQKYQSSLHPNQNLNRTYGQFVPAATFSYNNFQIGEFIDRYSINFNSHYTLPDDEQLFLLPDSSNLYFIRTGNLNLTPSTHYNITFQYRHNTVGKKNNYLYGGSLTGEIIKNYFADSIAMDQEGRSFYYNTNLNGYRYLNLNLHFNKSFIIGENQIQTGLRSNSQLMRNPGYFRYTQSGSNVKPGISRLFMQTDSLSVHYSFKNYIALSFTQSLTIFSNKQKETLSESFKNLVHSSTFGIGFTPTRKLKINTTISIRRNTSTGSSTLRSNILNAFISYRLLPSDNLELKITGWDIFNQNRGILNYGNNYSYTEGTTNLLHRYFMVTLSFYPRKFGKKAKN